MHLYLYPRGKFEQVKLWESLIQSYWWKFRRYNNKTKEDEVIMLQGSLRPSVLGAYEYVFPKEALTEVCSILGINENEQYGFGTIGLYFRHWSLRKIFGCKKIPKKILKAAKKMPASFTTDEFERGSSNCIIPGVAIHTIGIREDAHGEIGDFTQELV